MSDPITPAPDQYDSEPAEGSAGFKSCAIRAVKSARMQIALLSQTLDRGVYGTADFIEPLTTFLLAHERAQLRVLLRRPDVVMKSGHRLVELGRRRLSSRVSFRELSPERQQSEQELLVADESAVLLRESPLEVTARYWPHAPLEARTRLREFETLWQDATPATELHSLGI
ncbi:MAG: hypothetical protein ACRESS_02870 [Stenotrophobium sp.]